jgi:spore maturation protein CgeB
MADAPRIALLEKRGGLLTWTQDLACGFREAGAACQIFNTRPATLSERKEAVFGKRRLFSNIATCRRLAKSLAEFSPDLVLLMTLPGLPVVAEEILRGALPDSVRFAGWVCDRHPFPDGFAPCLNKVYYFDSACRSILAEAYADGGDVLQYLPLAACPIRYRFEPRDHRAAIRELAFAGNCTPSRKEVFAAYRKLGGEIELFGPHSGAWRRPWRNRRLSSRALGRIYRSYLVNLNVVQAENTGHGLNLRAFEIPCAGGLGTYPDSSDVRRCFEIGKEILIYRDLEDLKRSVERLIRNPEEALAMAAAGHRRVMREHTFYHRAARILADFGLKADLPRRKIYLTPSL